MWVIARTRQTLSEKRVLQRLQICAQLCQINVWGRCCVTESKYSTALAPPTRSEINSSPSLRARSRALLHNGSRQPRRGFQVLSEGFSNLRMRAGTPALPGRASARSLRVRAGTPALPGCASACNLRMRAGTPALPGCASARSLRVRAGTSALPGCASARSLCVRAGTPALPGCASARSLRVRAGTPALPGRASARSLYAPSRQQAGRTASSAPVR
jgi:hypothetical protein